MLLPVDSHVPADHQLDPLVSLAWLAAHTRRIALGTSVLVLPYRGAAATAKALSTIDWLSGGRLVVGVGAGWLRSEFDALGVPFDDRGPRTDAAIGALRELSAGHGELTSLPAGARERRGVIPILVGGSSRAALERAARLGDGWHPLNLSAAALAELVPRYREACAAHGRPAGQIVVRCFPREWPQGPNATRFSAMIRPPRGNACRLRRGRGRRSGDLVGRGRRRSPRMIDRWERFAAALVE